jgi:uncharacterized protein YdeI (YjbR/CyaY-like superfamily)
MNGKASQTVALADDVAAALRAAGLVEVFERLPPSHRQEYLTWIDAAKQAATRARRVGGMVERLKGR